MTASPADYLWVRPWLDSVSQAYCLTLARGLTPAQFLARLGARTEKPDRAGVDLSEPSFDVWNTHEGSALFIGATTVHADDADWVLGLEVNGYLGVTPEAMIPVSAGTTVVSHYRNVNAADRFSWFEDGELRVSFEPLAPAWREGSTPDALVGEMRQVGFDLGEDAEYDDENDLTREATFALAETLTGGVRLTPDLLDQSIYLCGIAPLPG